MPHPVSQSQTVQAINETLGMMRPPGQPIANLNTNEMSNPAWSCNSFAPALLETICRIIGVPVDSLHDVEYHRGAALPGNFTNDAFVNISMMGDPSPLNHNFNILVSGGITYLIQAYTEKQVYIVRRFLNATFITNWHNLSNNVNWTNAYTALFGVAPNSVVPNPPPSTWLATQYVTQ